MGKQPQIQTFTISFLMFLKLKFEIFYWSAEGKEIFEKVGYVFSLYF